MIRNFLFFIALLTVVLGGCAEGTADNKEANYEATKKMVVDILQTEDGKKAIQEVIADEKMKKELVIQSEIVKDSINETLISQDGTEMWTNLFKDPSFVDGFVKSTEDGQKELYKSLMYDAQFQKQMIDLFQNPEMKKQTLTVMKGQEFREHLEETIQQTLDSPLFMAKIEKTLLKAAEQKGKEDEKTNKKDEDEGGKDEGNSENNNETESAGG